MHRDAAAFYRDPLTGSALQLDVSRADRDDVVEGALLAPDGRTYPIHNGIPDLSYPQTLESADERVRAFYDARVEDYDRYLHLTFETFGEREDDAREAMVDRLQLAPNARVLEIGCGSGRDSAHIVRRIPNGHFFCQDLSPRMLIACRERLKNATARTDISVGNATYLPFADRTFDAVFQFGGVGEFGDIGRFFREAARVTRVGGRVVAGDESMPVWLRQTEFAKLLTFTNPQYAAPLPLEHLPIEARDVNLRWIIGGTFYLIDFTVGEGEPPADFDFVIPGPRGGTRRTRVYGQLEGVTPETKALAQEARERMNVSMHDWLETVVREAAKRQLADEIDKT
jgi:ubiquinone/menaquinone biosynthesis C-methylase UbiE